MAGLEVENVSEILSDFVERVNNGEVERSPVGIYTIKIFPKNGVVSVSAHSYETVEQFKECINRYNSVSKVKIQEPDYNTDNMIFLLQNGDKIATISYDWKRSGVNERSESK